jgi:hypothetical protein
MPAGDAGEQNMSSSQNPSIESIISRLASAGATGLYRKDFLLTWEKSQADLEALFLCADALKALRDANISSRVFDSGLAISQFRDNSTRTRFSYASAANLLGLEVQDLDEGKSQIAHGETVRETANMISFLADAIGIRDDMYIGRGNAYMREVARALDEGFADGVLPRRPAIVNLQCDIDHPTQTMSDALHLRHELGELKGKKLAMTWAYSPSYGKPLSVPQGVAGLMTRFGMDVVLAHRRVTRLCPKSPSGRPVRPRPPAGALASAIRWMRPSKAPMWYIPRAGPPSPPWRSERSSSAKETWRASRPWKAGFLSRTKSIPTGSATRRRWRRPKTPCTSTAFLRTLPG